MWPSWCSHRKRGQLVGLQGSNRACPVPRVSRSRSSDPARNGVCAGGRPPVAPAGRPPCTLERYLRIGFSSD